MPDQSGRVAIVTGANAGIGFETAKALAAKGATVVVASRNERRGVEAVERLQGAADGAGVTLMMLDLASLASVRSFAESFRSRFTDLDLLINSAGVMNPPTRRETEDGFELQLGTNHLGHFALTALLFERLTATERSRVVTVSSILQRHGELDLDDPNWTRRPYDGMKAYTASKIANMLFTLELQRRLTRAGASTLAVACQPGWTNTGLQDESAFLRMVNPIFGMKPWKGALSTLYAATAQDVQPGGYYGPHGLSNWRGYPVRNDPSPGSADPAAAARLWELSEELVGIEMPEGGPG